MGFNKEKASKETTKLTKKNTNGNVQSVTTKAKNQQSRFLQEYENKNILHT
jgi:hypothetical protein